MSDILSDSGSSGAINLGQSPLDFQPSARDYAFREWLLRDVLSSPAYKDHAAWVNSRILVDGLEVPIGQIQGFAQFTAAAANIATAQNTNSAAYVDLATAGPTLSDLSNGQYLVIISCKAFNGSFATSYMSYSVNGAAATDATAAVGAISSANAISTSAIGLVTLSNTVNTIQSKYRDGTGGGLGSTFSDRNIIALKYANL